MLKKDLLKLIENIADEEEVDKALQGNEAVQGLFPKDFSKATIEDIKAILEGEIGKAYITSHDDSIRSHAVETYKNGKGKEAIEKARLEGIQEGKTGKKKTPEMERIEALEKKNAELEAQALRNSTNATIGKLLNDSKLPGELVNFVYGDGKEETYKANIDSIGKILDSYADSRVQEKIGNWNYNPPIGGNDSGLSLEQQVAQAMGLK